MSIKPSKKQLATEAARILESQLYKQIWNDLRSEALVVWENTAADETAAREDAWRTIKVLSEVNKRFEKCVKQGEIEKKVEQYKPVDVHPPEK